MIKKLSDIFGIFSKKKTVPPAVPVPRPAVHKVHKTQFHPKPQKAVVSAEQKRIIELLGNLKTREEELNKRLKSIEERESHLLAKESRVEAEEESVKQIKVKWEELQQDAAKKLEQIAAYKEEDAREEVIKNTERKLVSWVAKKVNEAKDEIKSQEEELAREILIDAIRHGVVDWVAEYTVSTIKLGDDEVKGRIIGREGRNIRAFEKTTGVELELDETNDIRLSSFDPVRREIAKIALEKLVRDGRIQPSRIEEVVEQTKSQMNKILLEEGKRICQAVGVYHLPIDLVELIGKFKYRFSYGQNLAQHTIEETRVGVALANELKVDVKVVRLGCLLHDIGKVITEEEGSHIQLGVDLLKRYQIPEKVIACVAEHHEDKPFSCVESSVVWIADAVSGSRPGARYEAHEEYIKRMENVEQIVRSFEGVRDVAAYQAGREVRVIIEPDKVSDEELTVLVQKMAEKLDEEAKWAGQIKITAIRELRAVAVAPVVDNARKYH